MYYVLCLQLAVSNTNKLYIWGASPQVLRLQAQAQKKIRILEQQDANEKRNKALGELEKIPSDATNLNGKIKEVLNKKDGVQTKSSHTETSDIETQKKLETKNVHLKDFNFDLIEESQTHLKPCVVDTSLVKGQINQVRNIRELEIYMLGLINTTIYVSLN